MKQGRWRMIAIQKDDVDIGKLIDGAKQAGYRCHRSL